MAITYKTAGVDIEKANRLIAQISADIRRTHSDAVMKDAGSFGSFFRLNGYRDPVLVSSTDGVGTKLKIAFLADRHDTVGIDLVAMSVNDVLCSGARPLFFLDYIAASVIRPRVYRRLIAGIARGCRQAGCALIGGETAEMPGMYAGEEYDVAGFCVGAVERARMLSSSYVREGDLAVGLASSGLHSNGFSLVRRVFSRSQLRARSRQLLVPTRIYVVPVLSALAAVNRGASRGIRSIAHITGGAYVDKIVKVLPPDKDLMIEKNSWQVPRIFTEVQQRGRVSDAEMYRTFNMGVGMVLIVDPRQAARVRQLMRRFRIRTWIIGEVIDGAGEVHLV